ncbi:MAG: 3-oxoacyl-ACP reductase [Gammaproteobacteria bacterium]|jgi:3-oxoacyl-[acyl-carrier protein] reductase|nr:3-oxoacyl-ACP reductase [Gammaproteobacteria bacterium]
MRFLRQNNSLFGLIFYNNLSREAIEMAQHEIKQVAVVTGAGGGFGLEIVKQLLEQGFYVAATDITVDALGTLDKNGIKSEKLKTFVMDVSDKQSVSSCAEKVVADFDAPISVLVNNAGVFQTNPILMPDPDNIAEEIIKINLLGTFYCVSVFGKIMAKNKFGRIINIASIAGIFGSGEASSYAASKAGVIAATKAWARELSTFGITTNSIAPGFCKTEMMKKHIGGNVQAEQLLLSYIPVKRFGMPADIAEIVCFLASSKTNYMNGQVLVVDGGMYTGSVRSA